MSSLDYRVAKLEDKVGQLVEFSGRVSNTLISIGHIPCPAKSDGEYLRKNNNFISTNSSDDGQPSNIVQLVNLHFSTQKNDPPLTAAAPETPATPIPSAPDPPPPPNTNPVVPPVLLTPPEPNQPDTETHNPVTSTTKWVGSKVSQRAIWTRAIADVDHLLSYLHLRGLGGVVKFVDSTVSVLEKASKKLSDALIWLNRLRETRVNDHLLPLANEELKNLNLIKGLIQSIGAIINEIK